MDLALPRQEHKNEVDYIMTTTPYLVSKYEVLISFNFASDHRPTRATLNLLTKKSRRHFGKPQATLKTIQEQKTYITRLNDQLQNLKNHDECTVNEYCQMIECSIKESLKNINEKRRQSILDEHTKELIKERSTLQNKTKLTKEDKENLKKLYKKTNKEIKKSYEAYRTNTIRRHLETSRSAKKAFKELDNSKTWIPSLQSGSNKSGSRMEIISIATDFYAKLYSQPKMHEATTHKYVTTPQPEVKLFDAFEILKNIEKLKMEKCPGPDGIRNEHIKLGKKLLLAPLTNLFNKILIDEQVPDNWTKSEIVLLYKKGDPADIGNYRPISLMSCMYKLFASCLLNRITLDIDSHQPYEQAGFRSGFSTIDHIHVVEQVIEKYLEFRRPLYLAFIDYKKAFDSIYHSSIWETLTHQNINTKYINILKDIYSKSVSRIKLERTGNCINIYRGVRQGDPISPKLFIAVLQNIIKDLPWSMQGINVDGKLMSHLRFADDIILLSENPKQLNIMINDLQTASYRVGLEMNLSKTKIMTNDKMIPIFINNKPLEYVQEYVYLGKQLSLKPNRNVLEINRRIASTWKKFWAHKEILKSQLPMKLKKIVLDSAILPCLTYGCQTWTLDKKSKIKIKTTQRAIERSCLGITLRDKVKATEIRKKTKVTDALHFAQKLKWKWAGHVARYTDRRWTLAVTKWKGPKGTRGRGRPCTRWQDDIKAIAGDNWIEKAKDREIWQSLEEAFTREGSVHGN